MYFIFRLKSDPTYLSQSIFLKEQNYMEGFILCIIIVIVTLFISALSWRYLEIPARNYLNKIFNPNGAKLKTIETTN
jgi:peptidoglycan/LPS O-acetylase OafA/YrhL